LADGSVFFLQPLEGTLALFRLDEAGNETRVASLPTVFDGRQCRLVAPGVGETSDAALSVQEDYGFSIDEAGAFACLTIADRNDNMADVRFTLRVDLKSGQVASALNSDAVGSCKEEPAPPCEGKLGSGYQPRHSDPEQEWPFTWDPERSSVIARGASEGGRPICAPGVDLDSADDRDFGCAAHEGLSQSGRFVLVSGALSEGDYIHRELYLIDLQSGELLGMMGDALEFKVVSVDEIMTEGFGSLDVVGESDLRWVGGDRLWVDGWLIDPAARRAAALGEYLAW
jgi:hypothetical protein